MLSQLAIPLMLLLCCLCTSADEDKFEFMSIPSSINSIGQSLGSSFPQHNALSNQNHEHFQIGGQNKMTMMTVPVEMSFIGNFGGSVPRPSSTDLDDLPDGFTGSGIGGSRSSIHPGFTSSGGFGGFSTIGGGPTFSSQVLGFSNGMSSGGVIGLANAGIGSGNSFGSAKSIFSNDDDNEGENVFVSPVTGATFVGGFNGGFGKAPVQQSLLTGQGLTGSIFNSQSHAPQAVGGSLGFSTSGFGSGQSFNDKEFNGIFDDGVSFIGGTVTGRQINAGIAGSSIGRNNEDDDDDDNNDFKTTGGQISGFASSNFKNVGAISGNNIFGRLTLNGIPEARGISQNFNTEFIDTNSGFKRADFDNRLRGSVPSISDDVRGFPNFDERKGGIHHVAGHGVPDDHTHVGNLGVNGGFRGGIGIRNGEFDDGRFKHSDLSHAGGHHSPGHFNSGVAGPSISRGDFDDGNFKHSIGAPRIPPLNGGVAGPSIIPGGIDDGKLMGHHSDHNMQHQPLFNGGVRDPSVIGGRLDDGKFSNIGHANGKHAPIGEFDDGRFKGGFDERPSILSAGNLGQGIIGNRIDDHELTFDSRIDGGHHFPRQPLLSGGVAGPSDIGGHFGDNNFKGFGAPVQGIGGVVGPSTIGGHFDDNKFKGFGPSFEGIGGVAGPSPIGGHFDDSNFKGFGTPVHGVTGVAGPSIIGAHHDDTQIKSFGVPIGGIAGPSNIKEEIDDGRLKGPEFSSSTINSGITVPVITQPPVFSRSIAGPTFTESDLEDDDSFRRRIIPRPFINSGIAGPSLSRKPVYPNRIIRKGIKSIRTVLPKRIGRPVGVGIGIGSRGFPNIYRPRPIITRKTIRPAKLGFGVRAPTVNIRPRMRILRRRISKRPRIIPRPVIRPRIKPIAKHTLRRRPLFRNNVFGGSLGRPIWGGRRTVFRGQKMHRWGGYPSITTTNKGKFGGPRSFGSRGFAIQRFPRFGRRNIRAFNSFPRRYNSIKKVKKNYKGGSY